MKAGGILLMGGDGRRFGSEIPKQFHLLAGKKVYLHTLETFLESGLFEQVVLVCHPEWVEEVRKEAGHGVKVVSGGKTRQESSYRGICELEGMDLILVHDAVRPFVTEEILRENLRAAEESGAADTCIPSADTLVHAPGGKEIKGIPQREEYLRGQTPQTFRTEWIREAHEKAAAEGVTNASDDCRLVLRLGKPVQVVPGNERNMKITSAHDLWIAEQFAKCFVKNFREG